MLTPASAQDGGTYKPTLVEAKLSLESAVEAKQDELQVALTARQAEHTQTLAHAGIVLQHKGHAEALEAAVVAKQAALDAALAAQQVEHAEAARVADEVTEVAALKDDMAAASKREDYTEVAKLAEKLKALQDKDSNAQIRGGQACCLMSRSFQPVEQMQAIQKCARFDKIYGVQDQNLCDKVAAEAFQDHATQLQGCCTDKSPGEHYTKDPGHVCTQALHRPQTFFKNHVLPVLRLCNRAMSGEATDTHPLKCSHGHCCFLCSRSRRPHCLGAT